MTYVGPSRTYVSTYGRRSDVRSHGRRIGHHVAVRRARTGRSPVYCSAGCRWRHGHDRARARRVAAREASESWSDLQVIAWLNAHGGEPDAGEGAPRSPPPGPPRLAARAEAPRRVQGQESGPGQTDRREAARLALDLSIPQIERLGTTLQQRRAENSETRPTMSTWCTGSARCRVFSASSDGCCAAPSSAGGQ